MIENKKPLDQTTPLTVILETLLNWQFGSASLPQPSEQVQEGRDIAQIL